MLKLQYFPDFIKKHVLPASGIKGVLDIFQVDLRTGIVTLDEETGGLVLVFVRGMLVSVYRENSKVMRIDPYSWVSSINGNMAGKPVGVFALTPQDIRIFKILIEQQKSGVEEILGGESLEQQLSSWKTSTMYGLAKVTWPNAEALVLYPGGGQAPIYSLFITSDKLQHSAGSMEKLLSWHEKDPVLHFYSSKPGSEAWSEFLLHRAFTRLLMDLMKKYEKLASREQLNQIIRDINFKATAHDWNISITAGSVNDQIILSSPEAVANVYGALLEVMLYTMKNGLGESMYNELMRELKKQMPMSLREVVNKHIPVAVFSLTKN